MASILKVDDLRGNTSAGNITITSEGGAATMQLQQGVAKAWMNLNGTGTIATRDTLNISSVTDNGTGDYTPNLSSSMSNANYSIGSTQGGASAVDVVKVLNSSTAQTASLFRLLSLSNGFSTVDSNYLYASVHGDMA
jgi:hypothetical protein